MSLALRCTQGALAGTLIEVDSELVFGRGLPGQSGLGGDPKLSRRHARVYVEGSSLIIEDLGSTNGTWVNDQRLSASRVLQAGDRVRCGDSAFEVAPARRDETRQSDPPAGAQAGAPPPPPPVAAPPPRPAAPPPSPAPAAPPPPPPAPAYEPPPPPAAAPPPPSAPPPPPAPAYEPPPPPAAAPPPPPPVVAPPPPPAFEPTRMPQPAAGAGPHFQVTEGPLAGQVIPLGAALGIGRAYGEPGALGGDTLLSRRHARIALGASGVYFVQDTGSTNGTLLNGNPLRHAQPLGDGDELKVGSTTLIAQALPRAPMAPEFEDYAPPVAAAAATRAGAGAPAMSGVGAVPPSFAPQGAATTRLGSRKLIGVFIAAFLASIGVGVAAVLIAAPPKSGACPNGFVCQKPSKAPPLQAQTTFKGALGWSAEYDPTLLTPSTANATGNLLILHESDHQDKVWGLPAGSNLIAIEVHGYPRTQMTAHAAMAAMASTLSSSLLGTTTAPSSDQMFTVPVLGFHPAVGEVLEGNAKTPQGPGGLLKVAVVGATQGKVTVAAGVLYSVQRASSQVNDPDRPLDQIGDQVLETVRFPSDGPS